MESVARRIRRLLTAQCCADLTHQRPGDGAKQRFSYPSSVHSDPPRAERSSPSAQLVVALEQVPRGLIRPGDPSGLVAASDASEPEEAVSHGAKEIDGSSRPTRVTIAWWPPVKPDGHRSVQSPLERLELCVHNGDAVGKHPYVVAEDLDQALEVAPVLGEPSSSCHRRREAGTKTVLLSRGSAE